MGLFNPSSDEDCCNSSKPEDKQINSPPAPDANLPSTLINSSSTSRHDLDDSVKNVLSSANDLASTSLSTVLNILPEVTNEIRSSLKDFQESTSESLGGRFPNGFPNFPSGFGGPNGGRFFDFDSSPWDSFLKGGYYKTNDDGYIAYPVPSARLYDECKKVNGLSAWDQKGYWHCLFPKVNIPADSQALSKEDVEGDFEHKFGYWFQNYNDLLNWQSKMHTVIKEKKKAEWAKFREQEKKKWSFLNDGVNGDKAGQEQINNDVWGDSASQVSQKYPVKTYSSTFMKTLENGDTEKTTTIKRKFDDGSREVREVKEIIDQNGSSRIVNQDVSNTPAKRGWFWNGKGDNK